MTELEALSLRVSHPSKQGIIAELYNSPRPLRIFEIAQKINKDESTVEHHLNQLKQMDLIETLNAGHIKAYSLSELGKTIAQGIKFGYLDEEEEISLRSRELAAILGIDPNSDKFERIEQTIRKWYYERKKELEEELKGNPPIQVS
jgi:predicted ArsR family transcriptional regulator